MACAAKDLASDAWRDRWPYLSGRAGKGVRHWHLARCVCGPVHAPI